jgi:aspartate racemase
MFVRLEQVLRIRLPIATLFEAPTIEGLAAVIQQGGRAGQWRSLVAIQSNGTRAPIFGVPGVGGNVLCYSDIARFMAPEQPFYGLQSRGLDGTEEPLTRIEDIAAAFIQELREVQPEGPYYLAGMCMGGIVVYEIAQQLRAAGQEIGLLVLLETWPPVGSWARLLRPGARVLAVMRLIRGRLRLYAETLGRLDTRHRMKYLLGRLKMVGEMLAKRDVFRGDRSEFYQDVVNQANLIAYQQYKPRPYTGRVVFFRAEGRRVSAHQDRRLAWHQLISGDLEIQTVPGDDSGLMLAEPHVQVLARELKLRIERATAATAPPTRAR